jgi:extracellular matrix regulatory protein A
VLVDIGNGNLISTERVVTVEPLNNGRVLAVKREALCRGLMIDACAGRTARSAIHLDSSHVVISPVPKEEVIRILKINELRYGSSNNDKNDKNDK